jgi:methionine-rich copper-binding protein CopC
MGATTMVARRLVLRRARRGALVATFLALVALAGSDRARADHAGTLQLNGDPAGPYRVSAWTLPTAPEPGILTVSVAVLQEGYRAVPDARVEVTAEPADGSGTPATATASRDRDPFGTRYVAELALAREGSWTVTVRVSGPRGGGSVAFPVEVTRPGARLWLWAGLAAGGFGAGGAWLLWRRRRVARPAPAACLALGLALALGAGLLAPTPGATHAELVRSTPARRAVLLTGPTRVRLWFSEPVEAAFSRLSVWDARNSQVDLQDPQVDPGDPKQLSVGVPSLEPGTYTVRFRVLSIDGHVVESQFPFTIRPRR